MAGVQSFKCRLLSHSYELMRASSLTHPFHPILHQHAFDAARSIHQSISISWERLNPSQRMLSRIQRVRMTANTNKLFHHGFKNESIICDLQKKKTRAFRLCLPQSVTTDTDSGFHYSPHVLSIKIFLDVKKVQLFVRLFAQI